MEVKGMLKLNIKLLIILFYQLNLFFGFVLFFSNIFQVSINNSGYILKNKSLT